MPWMALRPLRSEAIGGGGGGGEGVFWFGFGFAFGFGLVWDGLRGGMEGLEVCFVGFCSSFWGLGEGRGGECLKLYER